MHQSAAYHRFTDDDGDTITTAPALLVAVNFSGASGASYAVIYHGTVAGGVVALQIFAAAGTTATFTPASPVALPNGLAAYCAADGDLTVIYA